MNRSVRVAYWLTCVALMWGVSLSWVPMAHSNPGYVGFGAGGPTFESHNAIVMDSEDLVFQFSGRGVWAAELTYVLRNSAAKVAEIAVGFPYLLGTDYVAANDTGDEAGPWTVTDNLEQ